MDKIFFENWQSIVRTTVITIMAYAGLVAMLRVSGKRTLSKMNAFDFIVTIALGSSLATVALNRSVPLADGLLAFALLIGLQAAITTASVRYPGFKDIIATRPTLLFYMGQPFHDVLKKKRITMDEVRSAVREQGLGSLDDVAAVVLETAGELTVVGKLEKGNAGAFTDVENYSPEKEETVEKSDS